MKGLLCLLLLLETFVFVVQQHVDEGFEKDSRAKASTSSHLSISDIHAALRELTAVVTEQKGNIIALETRLRDEINKKNDETLSQVDNLRKENKEREIAFSAGLMQTGKGLTGPFPIEVTLIYKNVITNIGNAYNPITGFFTAPLKGAYMFRISMYGNGGVTATAEIMKNGKPVVLADAYHNEYQVNSSNGVVLILEVGDVVYVKLWAERRIHDNSEENLNTFSGFLLFPLK